MPDTTSLTIFIAASIALLVVPGPAVFYVVARSLEQGRVAGLVSTLGINLGTMVHILFAALGLSALLVQSAVAFSLVKYLGATYLIYLGIRAIISPAKHKAASPVPVMKLSKVFTQGFIVNLLNPKTALFFLAFLPQFVDPSRGSVEQQIVLLGLLFVALATISDCVYAFLAGSVRQLLVTSRHMSRIQNYFSGTTYIALGIATALSGDGRGK